jgi:hypothetical protein
MDYYGNFVVAFTYAYSSTDLDVYARQYNASGFFQGTVYVATSGHNEYSPSVDMNPSGTFVVAYTYDYSSTDQDIYASSFQSTGGQLTHSLIAGSGTREVDPSAAIDAGGNYVVAYSYGSGYSTQVQALRVSAAGYPVGAVTVDSPWSNEYDPSVDMTPDGRFVVAYSSDRTDAYGTATSVFAAEFTASGAKIADGVYVAYSVDSQYSWEPTVAMNSSGNYAVVYSFYTPGSPSAEWGKEFTF